MLQKVTRWRDFKRLPDAKVWSCYAQQGVGSCSLVSEDGARRNRPARTATKDGALMQKVDKGRLPQSAQGCDNKNTKWLTQRSFLTVLRLEVRDQGSHRFGVW